MKANELSLDDIEDLQYELNITLEALLLLAGVRREKLDDAVQSYIECIDEVLAISDKEGADGVLAVINHLKTHKKDLFS